jgi:DNA-binding transcriptional LysR family regulator
MRFRHLEVFHSIYTSGSISGAARALGISQPSVSKMLHHAEDQLGFPLFQLVRRRLVATDEAHALFREFGDIFDRLSSVQQTARNLKRAGRGHIRLAVVPSLGLSVTPRAVARFRKISPGVTFDIQTLHHDDLVRALHERECDLAIAYDPPDHPRLDTITIATGELAILFRKGDLETTRNRLPLSVLEGADLVGVTSSGPIGDLFSATAERLEIPVRETVSVQTFYIAAALVQYGAGITVIDEFTAHARLAPELDYRFIDPPLRFEVKCVTLDERPLSKTAKRFVDLLAAELKRNREGAGRS